MMILVNSGGMPCITDYYIIIFVDQTLRLQLRMEKGVAGPLLHAFTKP